MENNMHKAACPISGIRLFTNDKGRLAPLTCHAVQTLKSRSNSINTKARKNSYVCMYMYLILEISFVTQVDIELLS